MTTTELISSTVKLCTQTNFCPQSKADVVLCRASIWGWSPKEKDQKEISGVGLSHQSEGTMYECEFL